MALTLNQTIARIRTLALSHLQINSFYFGALPEFDTNGEINYAACFLEQRPGSIDRSERKQSFNFRIYFLDLVPESTNSEENETDVLSDMHSVAADFMAMLNYSEYQDDWWIEDGSSLVPVDETLNDLVAGVYMEFTVNTEYAADRCQIPTGSVIFENDIDMARTKILSYTGTGSEGNSFSVTNLSGKVVMTVYRATDYKRAIVTVPTDTDKIQIVGTDLGDRKGILSTTGFVGLVVGDSLISGEILDFLIYE